MRKIFTSIFILSFIFAQSTFAAGPINTYNLSDTSNFNIRFDGASAGDRSGTSILLEDFDNNGKADVVISSGFAANNGSNTGSIYVIYDSLFESLTGSGNTIDLSDSSNWNLRIDGDSNNLVVGAFGTLDSLDVDGDNKNDLVFHGLSSNNSLSTSGSLFILKNTFLDDFSGAGNTIDIGNSSSYNIRIDGAEASDRYGELRLGSGDFDGDGRGDLIASTGFTDGTPDLYLIYGSSLDSYSGTGNNVHLSNSENFNLKIEGLQDPSDLGGGNSRAFDIDGNGLDDLLIMSDQEDNTGSNAGSVFIIMDSILDDYTSTGNVINIGSSTSYTLRIDGHLASHLFGEAAVVGDIDEDGANDLIVSAGQTNYSYTDAGSVYVFDNSILDLSGTGNTLALGTSTNYSLRIDGEESDNDFADTSILQILDYYNDGKLDLAVGSIKDTNGSGSGALYILSNTLITNFSGAGNSVVVASSSDPFIRIDGAASGDNLALVENYEVLADANNDGTQDIFLGAEFADNNSRSNSGSSYLIYNFPHAVSVSSGKVASLSPEHTVTGTVSAADSVTTVSDVEYQIDSNSVLGTWNSCNSTDGSFDENTEDFSCSLGVLASGEHNIYIRAKDSNLVYTPQSKYAKQVVNIGTGSAINVGGRSSDGGGEDDEVEGDEDNNEEKQQDEDENEETDNLTQGERENFQRQIDEIREIIQELIEEITRRFGLLNF